MLLTSSLALMALSCPAPAQQLAPYGNPSPVTPAAASNSGSGSTGRAALEKFETYVVAFGGAENLNTLTLDDTTVANGQGPGLVLDGVTYSCNGNTMQWNGQAWFGQTSKNILGNTTDGQLNLKYDQPQTSFSFTLNAFDGFGDSATVTVYNSAGAAVLTAGPTSLPNATPVLFTFTGSDLRSVVIDGAVWPWSPILDDHNFDVGCTSPTLAVTGATAGGTATATVNCATAGGLVVLGYSLTGGGPVNVNAGCAVVTVSMTPPITQVNLTANGSGTATFTTNVPGGTTGVNVWVQAFDMGSCSLTNGVQVTL